MAKVGTSFRIDEDILLACRQKYPSELSKLVENFLKSLVLDQNLAEIRDIENEKKEIQTEFIKLQARMSELTVAEKDNIKKLSEKEQKEKEEQLKHKKCMNCGNFMGLKQFQFDLGCVCKQCYWKSTEDDINRWNNGV